MTAIISVFSVDLTGTYTVEEDGCSISPINATSLIYETPYPYFNGGSCKAEFFCPNNQTIRYSIQRFDIYDSSYYDDFMSYKDDVLYDASDNCQDKSIGMYIKSIRVLTKYFHKYSM